MRKKEEILKSCFEERADAKSDGHLSRLSVVNLLEVLIDIRDILSVDLEARKALKKALGFTKGGDHPDTH